MVNISKIIAPSFHSVHLDIKRHTHTHYWLKGGRGSCKSSFVGIEIPFGMMKDPNSNAVCLRKIANTLKNSVFAQIKWGIKKLGVSRLWDFKVSPMEITYIPTGQKIFFSGLDEPEKLKSIKSVDGYIKYVWYEELDSFDGMEEIRNVNQSLLRGGTDFIVFYTYNPPKSINIWVNEEALINRVDRLIHHSTYLTVPKEWLGEQFIIEAKHLKKVNRKAYKHEYHGKVTGTGGEIFTNVTLRKITDEEIANFDRIRRGIDWGYAIDPFHYGEKHFDKTRRKLYYYYEIHQVGLNNKKAAELVKQRNKNNGEIICDSAEPKSIAEFKNYGIKVKGAKKGPDSVEYGVKFLQDLEEIVIDPERCPNTVREFLNYELQKDAKGNFKADFPDKDNHSIDEARYSLEDDMKDFYSDVKIDLSFGKQDSYWKQT